MWGFSWFLSFGELASVDGVSFFLCGSACPSLFRLSKVPFIVSLLGPIIIRDETMGLHWLLWCLLRGFFLRKAPFNPFPSSFIQSHQGGDHSHWTGVWEFLIFNTGEGGIGTPDPTRSFPGGPFYFLTAPSFFVLPAVMQSPFPLSTFFPLWL